MITMDGESISSPAPEENTVSSAAAATNNMNKIINDHKNNRFICTTCFKIFQSGQALGGHQNAHLIERSARQTTPNILGAVLNHPLPPDDVQSLAAALSAGGRGTSVSHNKYSTATERPAGMDNSIEPRRRRRRRQHQPPLLTKNLLGEWKPIKAAVLRPEEEAATASSPFEEATMSDPHPAIHRVSRLQDEDDIDLQLSLKTSADVDLELKLA